MDALEQSACNPQLATVLAKSLLHILRVSSEKAVSSFKTLDAIPRVLKVACIQVQESKRPGNASPSVETTDSETIPCQRDNMTFSRDVNLNWTKCMEVLMELFVGFLSVSDDTKVSILRSSACISRMFDLFWEEDLRNAMLKYAVDLMKVLVFCY